MAFASPVLRADPSRFHDAKLLARSLCCTPGTALFYGLNFIPRAGGKQASKICNSTMVSKGHQGLKQHARITSVPSCGSKQSAWTPVFCLSPAKQPPDNLQWHLQSAHFGKNSAFRKTTNPLVSFRGEAPSGGLTINRPMTPTASTHLPATLNGPCCD